MSPCRTDHILPSTKLLDPGVWSLRGQSAEQTTSLLIVRTSALLRLRRARSAGCSEFPAYSQVLLRQRYRHLRTVPHVTTRVCELPGRSAHFWPTLMVAHESGLSHPAPGLERELGV